MSMSMSLRATNSTNQVPGQPYGPDYGTHGHSPWPQGNKVAQGNTAFFKILIKIKWFQSKSKADKPACDRN